jgi:hypothetical protein
MFPPWIRHLALGVLLAAALSARAAEPQASDADAKLRAAKALAAKIDAHLEAGWQKAGVTPAPLTSDAEFLRRLALDVGGRIPTVSEVRRFLADNAPDKREQAIEKLVTGPGYVNQFSSQWAQLLVTGNDADFRRQILAMTMEIWVRRQFAENRPYDQFVRDILGMSVDGRRADYYSEAIELNQGRGNATPMAFLTSREGKPEELAAATSRLFLGVRLECSQCHDHPFAQWKREQFWGLASFFAGIRMEGRGFGAIKESLDRRELVIPNTDRVAQAMFLDGSEPQWKYKVGPRTTLAEWITSKDNPYFSRAIVNRMWAHYMGLGFVEPVDDFNDDHKPSHPELLDEMAKAFAAQGFDLQFLSRAITMSKAYQLTSAGSESADPRLFSRMAVKGLSGEQLFDSLALATGYRDPTPNNQRFFRRGTPRGDFLAKFASQDKRTEYQKSIPQALSLMNGQVTTEATHVDRSELLAAVLNAPFLETPGKIETLFLATLSRKPTFAEAERMLQYAVKDGSEDRKALADILWALLNSAEFSLNH